MSALPPQWAPHPNHLLWLGTVAMCVSKHTDCDACAVVKADELPEASVFQLTTRVAAYKRMVDVLGTKKDTKDHRIKLKQVGEDIGTLAKKTSSLFKRYKPGPADKQRHAKLLRDFQNVLKEFQLSQRRCAQQEQLSLPKSPLKKKKRKGKQGVIEGDLQSRQAEEEPLVNAQLQEQVRIDGELEYNNLLIEEREQDIKVIQHQIGEVNEIFQDLAVLVTEQGEMVDDIEANIVTTYGTTSNARKELETAAKHQKSTRTKLCIITVIVVVVVVVLLIFLNVI